MFWGAHVELVKHMGLVGFGCWIDSFERRHRIERQCSRLSLKRRNSCGGPGGVPLLYTNLSDPPAIGAQGDHKGIPLMNKLTKPVCLADLTCETVHPKN